MPSNQNSLNAYFKEKGLAPISLIKGPDRGWRCRAKLAVRGTPENPQIGLFKEATHEVIDQSHYPEHHPKIDHALGLVREFIKKNNIPPYNEVTHTGVLRYLQFVVERSSGKVQLTWVLNKQSEAAPQKWDLGLDSSDLWHSIWINYNTSQTNNIFGSKWELLKGAPLIWERLGGVDACFHPASFAQANLDLFDRMLHSIQEKVPHNAKIAEFYAGVGVIGLSLAEKSDWVRCCEITPQAKECFEIAKMKLNHEARNKISFEIGLAAQKLDLMHNADCVIVDPPRKGLDFEVLKALEETTHIKTLVYVSCGWKSFQRDCDALLSAGWQLKNVEPYWFFPGTDHIEILAVFYNSQHFQN